MINLAIATLIFLGVLALLLNWAKKRFGGNKLGIVGKLIWTDHGRQTKPFFNSTFEVLGKPDLMYRINTGVLAVEYKSRYGPVFKSDVAQAKCAALAARGEGFKVVQLLVKTSTQEQYIELPHADAALYNDIKDYISVARLAKGGKVMPALPSTHKCRGCAFKYQCQHKV